MPLQIRRGTNAERQAMAQPLAAGELLYVTDDQRLYVGNGTTLGGVQITGYNNEDAIDAVGTALVAGSHTGITFTYGVTQDTANRIDATVNLSDYSGTIKADAFKGTFVADDSTILVDGVSGVLRGTLVGNLTGDVNGNVTGNLSGNVTGNLSGTVTGSLIGTVDGEVTGSVFADNSSIIVDAIDLKVYASNGFITGPLTVLNNSLTLSGAVLPIRLDNANQQILQATGINSDGTLGNTPSTSFYSSRGTLASPTANSAGDYTMVLNLGGFNNGVFQATSSFVSGYDAAANMADPAPASNLAIITNNNNGGQNIAFLDYEGVFGAPVIKLTGYATGSLPPASGAGDAGWMVFDTTTNQFKGWNGSSWVVLG